MEIKNGYTGIYKNTHDKKKYHLSATINKKVIQYYFCCIGRTIKESIKEPVPYKIDLEWFLKLKSLGHFTKLKQNEPVKKRN